MTMRWFGGPAVGNAVVNPTTGRWMPGDVGGVWDAATGGTKLTNLVDSNGAALPDGSIFADATGYLPVFGIDTDPTTEVVWLDFTAGLGQRVRLECNDRAALVAEAAASEVAAGKVGKGELVVNVRDYGATGDGTTDDTAAITAAANALGINGGELLFPPGTYRLTGTVAIPSNVTVTGQMATILVTMNAAAFTLPTGAQRNVFRDLRFSGTLPTDNIAVRQNEVAIKTYGTWDSPINQLTIEGCEFDRIQGTAVQMKHVQNFRIRNNVIRLHGYAAIGCHSGWRGLIEGNDVEGTGELPSYVANSYGIYVSTLEADGDVGTTTNPRSRDVLVRNNRVRNQAWSALDTHVGRRISFIGNTIVDCKASAINAVYIDAGGNAANALLSPTDIVIADNTIVYTAVQEPSTLMNMAILLRGSISTDVANRERATGVIRGNVIRGYGRQDSSTSGAIFVGCGAGIVVEGNSIIECRAIGVHVYDCIGTNVLGNTFVDLWRSTGSATAVFTNLVLEPRMDLTVQGNRFVRGRLTVGTHVPAGSVVNNSAVNGTNNANVIVTDGGNDWGEASFASAHTRQQTVTQNRRVVDGTAAPTSGTWRVNDQVRNTSPSSGGFVGWVCVNGGTPGTWRGFGAIAAS